MCVFVCVCVLNVCSKAPELKKRLKDLVRQRDDTGDPALSTGHSKDRMTGEFAMDIGMLSFVMDTRNN